MRFAVWTVLAVGLVVGHRLSGADFHFSGAAEPSPVRILAETIPGSVPPEFAADLLIRLADSRSGVKEGSEWREALYQQAFELAGTAQDAAPYFRATAPTDMRTATMARASEMLAIDGLSLRVRALRQLLELNPPIALDLIGKLEVRLPMLTCADPLVPNPSALFDIARKLPYDSFERVVVEAGTSSAIAPAIHAVLESQFSDEQRQRLLVTLAATLRSMHDDDRTFSASEGTLIEAIAQAVDRDEARGGRILLASFREFLVNQLTADRCAVRGRTRETFVPRNDIVVVGINTLFVEHGLDRLSVRELMPSHLTQMALPKDRRPSAKALAVAMALKGFHHDADEQPGSPDALDDPPADRFREEMERIWTALGEWTQRDEESAIDYFDARRGALQQLITWLKPGPDRDRALGEFITAVKSESIESGDVVMRAYAQVEELLGSL